MGCYDKWWLSKDMDNMGYLFEYCDDYCEKLYNVKIDKNKLLKAFMTSRFREEMENGQPKFLSQAAYDSLKQWISVDYDNNLDDFIGAPHNEYIKNQYYWIGWMYAYIHFSSGLSSKTIVDILPIEKMIEHYHLGHEMSKEVYYKKIESSLTSRKD